MGLPGFAAEFGLSEPSRQYRVVARPAKHTGGSAIVPQGWGQFGPQLEFCWGPVCSDPGRPQLHTCCRSWAFGLLCGPEFAPRCPT
jgi:hypothetical protein